MTTIPRKKAGRAWVAIGVGVLMLPLAFWGWRQFNDHRRARAVDQPDDRHAAVAADTTAVPIHEYLRFAATIVDRQSAQPDMIGQYLAYGLRKLAGAMGALKVGRPELSVDLRIAAEHILLNPESTANTNTTRSLLIEASAAIAQSAATSHSQLRQSAEAIKVDTPLPSQRPVVDHFFRESADAIDELAKRRGISTTQAPIGSGKT